MYVDIGRGMKFDAIFTAHPKHVRLRYCTEQFQGQFSPNQQKKKHNVRYRNSVTYKNKPYNL